MATLFNLPLLGQTMQEGQILRWMKQEGETIEGWEPLVEVMTDKVNMEVETGTGGVVRKLLVAEGQSVPVGAPIAIIGTADEPIDALLTQAGSGNGAAATEPVAFASTPSTSSTLSTGAPAAAPLVTDEPPAVSPRAREAAAAAGIDWKTLTVAGTGYEGMVTERDVQAHLATAREQRVRITPLAARMAAEHGVEPAALAGGRSRVRAADVKAAVQRDRVIPEPEIVERRLVGIRKVIADRLAAIYQAAPHVPLRAEVDMSAAADLRRQLQPEAERLGTRLTYTHLVAAALVRALRAEPTMNATLEGDLIRQYSSVNLGVAVALEDGLSVPVLRAAETLPLLDLAAALNEVAAAARAGKLPPDAYGGGTFTITPLGQYGVDSFDPILNPPQIGILGVGRIADRLVAHNGAPAVRPTAVMTLTFDHRAVDGAPAARLLGLLKELLENPARLLL